MDIPSRMGDTIQLTTCSEWEACSIFSQDINWGRKSLWTSRVRRDGKHPGRGAGSFEEESLEHLWMWPKLEMVWDEARKLRQGQIIVGLVSSGKTFGLGGNGEPLRVLSRGGSWLGVHLRKIRLVSCGEWMWERKTRWTSHLGCSLGVEAKHGNGLV